MCYTVFTFMSNRRTRPGWFPQPQPLCDSVIEVVKFSVYMATDFLRLLNTGKSMCNQMSQIPGRKKIFLALFL